MFYSPFHLSLAPLFALQTAIAPAATPRHLFQNPHSYLLLQVVLYAVLPWIPLAHQLASALFDKYLPNCDPRSQRCNTEPLLNQSVPPLTIEQID
ncbi:hypothetical protein D3C79_834450 [compost metagenome]